MRGDFTQSRADFAQVREDFTQTRTDFAQGTEDFAQIGGNFAQMRRDFAQAGLAQRADFAQTPQIGIWRFGYLMI